MTDKLKVVAAIREAPEQWKCGNEFLPYHHQASHINPDHRDGWNACYKAARPLIDAALERVKVLEAAINEHNEGCTQMCESSKGQKHCSAYLERGRSACPDCPRDMMIDSAAMEVKP